MLPWDEFRDARKALVAKLQLDVQLRQSSELRLAATVAGPKGALPLHSR
jgi:hypothetical protein